MKGLKQKAIEKVREKLKYHPGDAPWSCIECYLNQPCVDKVILEAALRELEK